ncbi:LysM peptidoglycan-binding domain-containing protein [Desulfomonile tiedjei]|uniref:LysM domain-containing protein n=1 Tax=Desulfomonile tiedjei (strain ATCC 49306 / DSM 6799 / DCB-1) TaxID=706587 RepID=I4CCW9_DESTA|nr:LysM peptidoglycan-binding domain-containing protein [Desulfomonile tiedjei]AFM27410.1 LysM domain-containing protein [Desulfomonile tiedjei DSM 6799]
MKRSFIACCLILTLGLITSCAYLQKPDVPPPLPPVETKIKPPFKVKAEHFAKFPWNELSPVRKDEPELNTEVYTVKEGDTLESIAEAKMGDKALAGPLGEYNEIRGAVVPGEKIVIPYPIIGVSSKLLIKSKGTKEFGPPAPFNTELNKGDEYKMRFETNADGYLYVFRQGLKAVTLLYPAKPAKPKPPAGRRARQAKPEEPPSVSDTGGKVAAHEAIEIPIAQKKGFVFDSANRGDMIFVFFSMRRISDLDDLKEKKTITVQELQAVMHRVKQEDVVSEPPNTVIRVSDPLEILGFTLNLNG